MRTARYFAFVIAIGLCVSPAFAQLSTVYASETDGKDVSSCGVITKPCKTFAFSLGQVAPKGRVIALNSGEYGAVRITKAVTIQAAPGADVIINKLITPTAGGAFNIEIAAGPNDDVTLRGLKVMSADGAIGILFSSGASLYVENCVVHAALEDVDIFPFGFTGDVRVFIRDSTFSGAGSGIRVLRHIANSVRVEIERSTMVGNYYGLMVGDGAFVTARNCAMVRNRNMGIELGGVTAPTGSRPTQLMLENDLISGNGAGIDSQNSDVTARVSHCTITDNDFGIGPTGSLNQILSRGNNTLEANGVDGTFTGVYTAK